MNKNVIQKLDNFFASYKNQKFKKGEILIKAEDVPSGIFYLKEGIVKQYAISRSGEELILNVYRPISFFPMSYAINNTLSHHYYEAMTEVAIWKAPRKKVLEFIKKNGDVLLDLVSRIYHGLDGFFLRMEYLIAGSARNRLIIELIIYAKRFGEKVGNSTLIKLKITEEDLASQSGMARETVSREIKKLKEKGLITFYKNILNINDLQKLEEELLVS